MKTLALFATLALGVAAADERIARMLDAKLTTAQRSDACFELRGVKDVVAVEAMIRALHMRFLRACAAENLRIAGALEALKTAAADPDPEIQSAVLPPLGSFREPSLLSLLGAKAGDANLLIATNALRALSFYPGEAAAPYLEPIARKGGIVGIEALNLLQSGKAGVTVEIARELLRSGDVPDKVSAMRILGESGDESDVTALRDIARSAQTVAVRQRGFGLMPAIDLSQAAKATIAQIERRESVGRPGIQ